MFEQLGYYKDYYIGTKFMGSLMCEKDRDILGYEGQRKEIAKEDIVLDNNRKIKAGTEYTSQLLPLCGKTIKK